MLDESVLEFMGENFGLEKHWQWIFRVENSPLWEITPMYMTKEKFLEFKTSYDLSCPRNKIVEFGKAKITKRLFESSNHV